MTRTVEIDTDATAGDRDPADAPASPVPRSGGPGQQHVQPRRVRLAGTAALIVTGVAAIALAPLTSDDRRGYVLAHALAAIAPLVAALVWAGAARHRGAPEYRTFWRHWQTACGL
ncbi:MAG TPA: hypothetical protein VJM49_12195, partial [Acidimicrobiales bacterium]|nr:hypothetical protein [Acidimicrobiales bacterium]